MALHFHLSCFLPWQLFSFSFPLSVRETKCVNIIVGVLTLKSLHWLLMEFFSINSDLCMYCYWHSKCLIFIKTKAFSIKKCLWLIVGLDCSWYWNFSIIKKVAVNSFYFFVSSGYSCGLNRFIVKFRLILITILNRNVAITFIIIKTPLKIDFSSLFIQVQSL